jgi:hypothetical protein
LEHTVETPLQYVQHLNLLLKHADATLVTYKKRQMKHLRHASETLATYVYKKTNETLGIDAYNIRVQSLQYMQHLDILLQHPPETIETYI